VAERARPEDYRLLGIDPQAGAKELERACQRARVLYSEGSLATYSMMGEDERSAMRARIEEAGLRIGRTIADRMSASFAPGEIPVPAPAIPAPDAPSARAAAGATTEVGAAAAPPSPAVTLDWTQPPGPQLRAIREDLGITLKQISSVTRIRSHYFNIIEEGDLRELPAPVYLRGFLLEYSRRLGLPEPEQVVVRYLEWAASRGWGGE
jgi:hypothetical protein